MLSFRISYAIPVDSAPNIKYIGNPSLLSSLKFIADGDLCPYLVKK